MAVDIAVRFNRQDDWRNNAFKVKKVRNAIEQALLTDVSEPSRRAATGTAGVTRERRAVYLTESESKPFEELLDRILNLVKNQHEY